MQVIHTNKSVFFDVDSTLLSWEPIDPSHPDAVAVPSETGRSFTHLKAHVNHIKQMKAHKFRGHTIFVWSAGGAAWAERAIIALGLKDVVDYVIDKPDWCYDDKSPEDYMPKSYWLHDEMEKQK
jgi:FMN phosphatase YigB (HAD superfamily)